MDTIIPDIDKFEACWDDLSKAQKRAFIQASVRAGEAFAILPVLKGLDSRYFSIRTQARKTFARIREGIGSYFSEPFDRERRMKGMRCSASVCSRLFACIRPGMSGGKQAFFFKALLSIQGKGADFAFKTLLTGRIGVKQMVPLLAGVADRQRLELLVQYLQADPDFRLKFARPFKELLAQVKSRDAVTGFYAALFDAGQDPDPFLYNLQPALRDPGRLTTQDLVSSDPAVRVLGLKALAMILPGLDPELLVRLLKTESDIRVRQTVYKVVERSTPGMYPQVFQLILDRLEISGIREGICALNALIVSGKYPLIKTLAVLRERRPDLMGHLYKEIAGLSRMAFLFIQDIALNTEAYLESNIEVNLAVVFGMIKKRPERVVRILSGVHSRDRADVRMAVSRFIRKAKKLVDREKQSIRHAVRPVVSRVKKASPGRTRGFFSSFFPLPVPGKKIDFFMENRSSTVVDFEGETLADMDLPGMRTRQSALYFCGSVIKDSNFSHAVIFNACFKRSTLYNVDFQNTVFDSVSFDGAFLINVNAKGAVFKDCSFQNMTISRCNFERAQMNGAFFIGAVLSETSFHGADLSWSSFAFARLDLVSLDHARLPGSDFSGASARFSRFPAHAKPLLLRDGADLNARQYQLAVTDMPELDCRLLSRINMLVFSEFIHYGEARFLQQNRYSLMTAFDIFKPRQTDLFRMIPWLLHENIVLPGNNGQVHPETPCGIVDYHPGPELFLTMAKYMPWKETEKTASTQGAIEALFTIGSIGSCAQTDDSDIDYWVCIREARYSSRMLLLLRKKLAAMEAYARETFHIQVTFFLVDIDRAKKNDFGRSTYEGSGTAQAMLLKEEFYRTMIHVAGKLPLWAVLPSAVSRRYYEAILNLLPDYPDFSRYIDLGDIHAIPVQEFFGASVWQMFKSLNNPFKSVLKMALLEKYLHEQGRVPLLCNLYKDEWMNSGAGIRFAENDAYFILMKYLLSYFNAKKDHESVRIVRTCFFLKLGISDPSQVDNTVFGLRRALLDACMNQWHWTRRKMFKAGSYKTWAYKDILSLSQALKSYMLEKYRTLNRVFEAFSQGDAQISAEDRTVLGRMVYAHLAHRPGKIKKNLLVSAGIYPFGAFFLHHAPAREDSWELVGREKPGTGPKDVLFSASCIEEIAGFLIVNQVVSHPGDIHLLPNKTPVKADNIRRLVKAMAAYFAPLLRQPVPFDRMLKKARIDRLFISVNFYARRRQKTVAHYTVIYMNTWSEMFVNPCRFCETPLSPARLADDIRQQYRIKKIPGNAVGFVNGSMMPLHQFTAGRSADNHKNAH